MLVMGVDDRGVEPWGMLVDGGREGCERGSIVIFGPNGSSTVEVVSRERGRGRGWVGIVRR